MKHENCRIDFMCPLANLYLNTAKEDPQSHFMAILPLDWVGTISTEQMIVNYKIIWNIHSNLEAGVHDSYILVYSKH
jgi:hypothetical protein